MIRVSISKSGTITNSATFETQELADSWLAYHNFSGDVLITDVSAEIEQARVNESSIQFLRDTDYKVLRHRDEQEMGLATTLTGEAFQELLQQRNTARISIIKGK